MTPKSQEGMIRLLLLLAVALVVATYAWMIDLKGISSDEGMRMAIINGGLAYDAAGVSPDATWDKVLETNSSGAYQPLYFLVQNTLMRLSGRQDAIFFRSVNIAFLAIALGGLVALSRGWRPSSRLFLIGLFSFNGFLLMHVLQIREYIVGLAFYIWSTWMVLQLHSRRLERPWVDIAWFCAYGLLLVFGFYIQSWVVFPAIAQGLFLLTRRAGDRLRYFAHLALCYLVVLCATVPYLRSHQQKVNVGLWASETTSIWSHVTDGFHLLLSGHIPGRSAFAGFLVWFWLAATVGALALVFLRRTAAPTADRSTEDRRQAALMALCIAVSLAFQLVYAWKIEPLSLWPRYFIIHYFFLTWLIALGFARLDDLRADSATPPRVRWVLAGLVGLLGSVMVASAVYQTRSYRADPYLDTGVGPASDWRTVAAGIGRALQPGDAIMVSDYVVGGTVTFSRPVSHPVILLPQLEQTVRAETRRIVYLEHARYRAQRDELSARLSSLGFPRAEEAVVHATDGRTLLEEWRLVIFTRD